MIGIIIAIVSVLLVITVIYVFLVAPRLFGKPDRSKLFGVHYAHRGLFDNESDAPENSINAFKKAVDAGYGIELDVQLSKDGYAVVFHDASLMRMCGIDGNVWEYTLEELQHIKLAKSNCTMPTFAEVLNIIDGKVPLIIEYKLDVPDTKVCETANRILENYNGAYCIESFHPYALMWYRKNRPDIIRGQLSMNYRRTDNYGKKPLYQILTYLLENFLTRPDFIAYNHKDSNNLSRNVCKKLGALSVAWTIKSYEQYEKAKDEFDLFIFDSFIL